MKKINRYFWYVIGLSCCWFKDIYSSHTALENNVVSADPVENPCSNLLNKIFGWNILMRSLLFWNLVRCDSILLLVKLIFESRPQVLSVQDLEAAVAVPAFEILYFNFPFKKMMAFSFFCEEYELVH